MLGWNSKVELTSDDFNDMNVRLDFTITAGSGLLNT